MSYVWCTKEECRVPEFRCLLCKQVCYPDRRGSGEGDSALEILINSGKYKEIWVMKRKQQAIERDSAAALQIAQEPEPDTVEKNDQPAAESGLFLLEDDRLKPFSPENYTTATLYQVTEAFSVECKLVRPDDPNALVYEGKKPSKKTMPILVGKDGASVLMDSWEALETELGRLSEAAEVLGATAVKQVFVLKRK